MAGIYIHIPFCKKACHYCNFHFSTSLKQVDELTNAICNEAQLRHNYINEKVSTIYFGGGTPSLLNSENLQSIIHTLNKNFRVEEDAEFTLEANPDDICEEKLISWRNHGINRLSIGIQSFFNDDLNWMNRAHSAEQALSSVKLAQQFEFKNISIDLIYGTPLLSDEKWMSNLETAFSLNIPHLSCYALTVEANTALFKLISANKTENINIDKQSHQFDLLMTWAKNKGYEHYEISNFATPNFRSRHNSSYWQEKSYLGLGPSAHSYNGVSRQWNVANNAIYVKSIKENIVPYEIEYLSSTQKINEYIMTALRTAEGIHLLYMKEKFGEGIKKEIEESANKFLKLQWMRYGNSRLILTDKGKHFADGIAAEMFVTEKINLIMS